MAVNPPTAAELARYHDAYLASSTLFPVAGPIWQAVVDNHRFNCLLWDEEDMARRTDVGDAEIARNKRAIDGFNQQRNDATERFDEHALASFAGIKLTDNSRLNSETAGAMNDRLSILSLKIFHMHKQTERADVDADHLARCTEKLSRLREQRIDLESCYDALLSDFARGIAHYKIYRQFKMYNDPTLNPQLYTASDAKESGA